MRRILASMVILGACTPEYGIKDHRNVPNITPDTQTTVDSPVEDPPFIVGTPEIHEKNPLILIGYLRVGVYSYPESIYDSAIRTTLFP